MATKPLFSASDPGGVSSVTSKPACASARGMRAAPTQRSAFRTKSTGVAMGTKSSGFLPITLAGNAVESLPTASTAPIDLTACKHRRAFR